MSQIPDSQVTGRQTYRVCPAAEIPEQGGVLIDIGGREIGVFKLKGQLLAYDNRCVHQGGPICTGDLLGATQRELTAGKEVVRDELDQARMRLVCPWHGWEYDLATGRAAHDESLRLRRFEVEIDGEGVAYVRV